ncbi:penicillin-binding protein [Pullulanibacillus camelliae]|uniref:Penicillin-binding protein n=1 Tax=Pullulanibacillus camelliae TaxID=1707096 RepID=A0A8J3DY84_9BACL|nr:penicillin-binding protein 2 [Pullulanibacillus camelliae]GGE46867.1 penicillin-binding protein [Pullulanibacillus camelliae]
MDDKQIRKKKKKKNHIPFRLNILFLLIFFAFSVLIMRLGYVQIVKGKEYTSDLNSMRKVETTVNSPRGLILDSEGKVLAGNKSSYAVVFTRKPNQDNTKLIDLAEKLSQYIDVSTKKDVENGIITTQDVTERDMKDYYITKHQETIYKDKLTKKEIEKADNADKAAKDKGKTANTAYDMVLDRITDKDLSTINEKEMKVIAIWRELVQAKNLTPTIIASHLSDKELARLGENLSKFNGMIDTSIASTRDYPEGHYFFLGNVKTIPAHQEDNYSAIGYNLNDLVGTSNLEEEYESVLRGIPTTYKFTKNSKGQVVGNPTEKEGQRGNDIELTVNGDLEKKAGDIIEKSIRFAKKPSFGNKELTSAYAVVMNPNTGAVLAMVGRTLDPNTGKFTDTSSATILNGFEIGSAAKPATLLTGYRNNAVPSSFVDKPITYKAGPPFKSYERLGTMTPETALQKSSNVYMAHVAGLIAGVHYQDLGSSYLATGSVGPRFVNAFKIMRDGYAICGLGVHTGIDLPFESTGYQGKIPTDFGIIHQFAIGQYDQYTPLQMAQYVSTIANGGYRIAPHLLDSVHAPGKDPTQLGPTVKTYKPKILNTIPNTKSQLDVVHKGMEMVTHTGGTASFLGSTNSGYVGPYPNVNYNKYKIAGKTGTAQIDQNDLQLYNETFIGYAPYDNPQIAVSVVVPKMRKSSINSTIAGDIIKYYFDHVVKETPK